MRITKKLVAETCLPVYYEVMEKGKDMNKRDFLALLYDKDCWAGICNLYFELKNDGHIYGFMIREINKLSFHLNPSQASTKKIMLECIQVRIDLLESWLK